MTFRLRHLALLTLCAPALAQMHHVDKPEKVTRAVGVYEWTGPLDKPTASRLVPVSVFIYGQYEDAGTYLARPVPFALETGNVYEVEQSGDPKGTLDLLMARDVETRRDVADDNPMGVWYGYGKFSPPGVAKAKPLPKAVNVASINETDDDRPHFVTPRSQTTDTTTAKPSKCADRTPDANDPERPTLARREDTGDTDTKHHKKEKPAGYVTGIPGGLNDDPDAPILRHGKAKSDEVPALTGMPANMHQAVAVSDPATPDTHVFTREWDSAAERTNTLAALHAIALKELAPYLTQNELIARNPTAAELTGETEPATSAAPASVTEQGGPPKLVRTPHGVNTSTESTPAHITHATPHSTAHNRRSRSGQSTHSAQPLTLIDEQLGGFELSYGGLPTFVYTAQAPVAPAKAPTAQLTAYVTLVVQQLPSGELQRALTSVTDSSHLNRTPRFRFIDAVDANGSHRASLLFELRAAHSRQFALYQLVTAQAQPVFTTAVLE